MKSSFEKGVAALVMDAVDHVATALRDLKSGETIIYRFDQHTKELTILEDIPFGHKVAIQTVQAGSSVNKYGEVIGRATANIQVGEHVHIHNVEGIRGRGDQIVEGGEAEHGTN